MKKARAFIYKYTLSMLVIWWLFIFVLCATPGQYFPSTNWLELLSFDKWVHAGLFYGLTSLFMLLHIKHQQSAGMLVLYLFVCISYGIALEGMQATIFSNRSADWQDVVANSFGCLIAALLYRKMRQQYGIAHS